jgi:hypothetical protein
MPDRRFEDRPLCEQVLSRRVAKELAHALKTPHGDVYASEYEDDQGAFLGLRPSLPPSNTSGTSRGS